MAIGQRQMIAAELAGLPPGRELRAVGVEVSRYSTPSVSCRPFIGTQITSRTPERDDALHRLERVVARASETRTPCFSWRT